jgi:drug/metabolite transporter (DMT)-like permease
MTLWARRLTLNYKKAFYLVVFCNYAIIALIGIALAIIANHGSLPALPTPSSYIYLIGVGIFIPLSWLLGYKLIAIVGASNGVIAGLASFVITALFGVVLLGESISLAFIIGCIFLLLGMYISLRIQPDEKHKNSSSLVLKVSLVMGSALAIAVGLLCEKEAITALGVWSYSAYGWGMQFVGATILLFILGRQELKKIPTGLIKNSLFIGLLSSIAGGLFIYALSKGTLSSTMMATSAKATLTVVLAAIFLKERNNIPTRILALCVSIVGLVFVLS